MERSIFIRKADGSEEPFEALKLEKSLRGAGASEPVTRDIVHTISSEMTDGATTREIYKKAFSILRRRERTPVAARYSLKKAIFDLGPSGFPFEDFIAELYRAKGYDVEVGMILRGKCAEHEVDLVAHSPKKSFGAEIKFHNHPGIKTDLKIALYVHARFNDLVQEPERKENRIQEGMLITNTKFTTHAIAYGECVGLPMIGWDYPKAENLRTLIEETGLHPITCLTTLPSSGKKRLIADKIVLCRALQEHGSVLENYGISKAKISDILNEASALCQPAAKV
ncbi:restriction endonuclease [Candidatus Kaiserbacteria bacterium]|nr:restriction endonuclease [Candidatus Kaiserbacteria bacterium]